MKRRHKHVGYDDGGRPLFKPVEGGPYIVALEEAPTGKPLAPGKGLVGVEMEGDGEHAMIETIVEATSGPGQVATASYRSGWDRTFAN